MTDEQLVIFINDLDNVTDITLPAWLVDGAKFCAGTLYMERKQTWIDKAGALTMKLYVDDERPCPDGWILAKTYQEAIQIIFEPGCFAITHLSLDHDLGTEKTGYDIACAIEAGAHARHLPEIPFMTCHSANPVGKERINKALSNAKRIWKEINDTRIRS